MLVRFKPLNVLRAVADYSTLCGYTDVLQTANKAKKIVLVEKLC